MLLLISSKTETLNFSSLKIFEKEENLRRMKLNFIYNKQLLRDLIF